MKIWKRGAALLLAGILTALTACGQKAPVPSEEIAMGRYIEEQWELPIDAVNVPVLIRRPDGKLFAIMNDKGPRGDGENVRQQAFSTSNGKDWEEETHPWLQALNKADGFVSHVAYGKNGECYVIYGKMKGEFYFNQIARVEQDGSLVDINGEWDSANADSDTVTYHLTLPSTQESSEGQSAAEDTLAESDQSLTIAESTEETKEAEAEEAEDNLDKDDIDWSTYFSPSGLQIGDDGDLYIGQYYGQILRAGADGKIKQKIGGESYPLFTYYNSQLAIIDYVDSAGYSSSFSLFDANTGEMVQELDNQMVMGVGNNQIATGEDGALYLANANGIYRLVVGGTTWERMVDGNLCSLSIPSMVISQFIPHGDNEFLTMVAGGDKPVLINYVYSDSTPTRPTTELTIATLKKDNTLLEAAGAFRRQHPEVLVTVQTILEEDGSATAADAIRALNTQLLAGNGPDLLLLDGLPLDSYIEKGVLADMSDWANPLIDAELLPNVAGALRKDGKLYAIPARFTIPTLWGKPEAIRAASSLEALADYAQANPGNRLLRYMEADELFRQFCVASYGAWLDSTGKLDQATFAKYLELISWLASTSSGPKEDEDMNLSPGLEWISQTETLGQQDLAYGLVDLSYAELSRNQSIMTPNGAISALNGVAVTADTTSVEDSLVPAHITLLPGQTDGAFTPKCIMGINAASGQQALTREFMETILSQAVQYSDFGLPVNKAAMEANAAREDDRWIGYVWDDEDGGEKRLDCGWPSHGVFRAIINLFDQLKTPYLANDTLMEMILSETRGYFDGSMSAEQAAAAVAARMEIYLAEQG